MLLLYRERTIFGLHWPIWLFCREFLCPLVYFLQAYFSAVVYQNWQIHGTYMWHFFMQINAIGIFSVKPVPSPPRAPSVQWTFIGHMQTSTSLPLWNMPIWIPNIHFGGSPRKIMTYFHLSACLWWAISIRHPAASGKNPEQCGEVGWNKYSSAFHFSQTSPKVTRLMAGQWSGHLQKTSWIYEVTFRPSTTLSFKKRILKKVWNANTCIVLPWI